MTRRGSRRPRTEATPHRPWRLDRPPRLSPAESACEEAWRRHVHTIAGPPSAWVEPVHAFVGSRKPRAPDQTAAVLLVCMSLVWGPEDLLEGRWVGLVTTHVDCYFASKGFGAARTLKVLDRFVAWLAQEGWFDAWDLERIRWRIDDARASCGLLALGERPLMTETVPEDRLDTWIEGFLGAAELGPLERDLAPRALGVLSTLIRGAAGFLDPERLHPDELAAMATLPDEEPGFEELDFEEPGFGPGRRADEMAAARSLLSILATFYRWLGREGRMRPERAEAFHSRLSALALGMPADASVA